ncbi:MAG: hypothetical protein JWQ54_4969 [Mucilaginibacter sp.]|nr:hypothetical protein [Mucilaginibacter sp.]
MKPGKKDLEPELSLCLKEGFNKAWLNILNQGSEGKLTLRFEYNLQSLFSLQYY